MLPSNDIFGSGWTGIVFSGRNQAYGAFQLRQSQEKTLLIAFLFTIMLFSSLSGYALYRVSSAEMAEVEIPEVGGINIFPPPIKDEVIIPKIEKPAQTKQEVLTKTIAHVPVIVKDDLVDDTKTQDELKGLNTGSVNIEGPEGPPAIDKPVFDGSDVLGTDVVDKPFITVEQMPKFRGGDADLLYYLGSETRYPEIAREYDLEGVVYVSFVIDKTGKIKDVKIARSVDYHLDKEALRVIKSMPDWKPGKQNGQPVSVQFTVPIKFVLRA
jgi:protein TonB